MKSIIFRCDASLEMGSGHVMRCLTLADELSRQGALCEFICREHEGHMASYISEKGYKVHPLCTIGKNIKNTGVLAHSNWLGTTQEEDANQVGEILQNSKVNWLIVDHYALDENWENKLRPFTEKIMVIDDLADRKHECDLLLDQTYGRVEDDYAQLVSNKTKLLMGAQYALLRPEFSKWRQYSLKRRKHPELKKILITMGGVDTDNISKQILEELKIADLPRDVEITVVLGVTAPHLKKVKALSSQMPFPTTVKSNVNNMAEIMAHSDVCIGAVGSTTWERCCLGLPSLLISLAKNQEYAALQLVNEGIVMLIAKNDITSGELLKSLRHLKNKWVYRNFVHRKKLITNGNGVNQVCLALSGA